MNRRDFVRLGCATAIGVAGKLGAAFAEPVTPRQVPEPPLHPVLAALEPRVTGRAADFMLRIAPTMVELAPQVVISTIGYSWC